jgi:hypothetical protein
MLITRTCPLVDDRPRAVRRHRQLPQLLFEVIEVDWRGEEIRSTESARAASAFAIANSRRAGYRDRFRSKNPSVETTWQAGTRTSSKPLATPQW